MPADSALDIGLACRPGSPRISQAADQTTIVAAACHPAVCAVPGGLPNHPDRVCGGPDVG
jgi:hypothetical protein